MQWTVEKVKDFLPDDFVKLLNFEDYTDVVKVSTKGFMHGDKGKETWRQINKLLKECGGSWISLGKDSHWKILKEQPDEAIPPDPHERMQLALEKIHEAARILEVDKP